MPATPQLCWGWALPIWAAVLAETHARARFAAHNVAHLLPVEKEWAVAAAVGYDWMSLGFQFPVFCLTLWHALLAAATAAAALAAARPGGGGG